MEMHGSVERLPITNPQPGTRWFCEYGCVTEVDGANRVFIGDTLLGEFDPNDRDLGPRNVLLVMLAKEPKIHLGHLAAAFEISDEHLRRLRQAAKVDGYRAVLTRARGCEERAGIDPAKIRELRALFEEGWKPTDATRRQRRRGRVSRATVSRERRRWQAEKDAARRGEVAAPASPPAPMQLGLLDGLAEMESHDSEAARASSSRVCDPVRVGKEAVGSATEPIGDEMIGATAEATTAACANTDDATETNGNDAAGDVVSGGPVPEGAVAADATTGTMNADEAIAELPVTSDVIEEDLVDELADDRTGMRVDDGAAPADLAADVSVEEAASLEPVENAAQGALAGEERGPVTVLRSRPVASGRLVQHVGSWLLLALAQQHGLYEVAERLAGNESMRIPLDATLAALAIGERTVEGIRRLATQTAPLLLRCDRTPTANTVRRHLHAFANEHGATLMANVGERYLDRARATGNERAVFYVDNHMRTYTGQEVVRRGWRMQDKRVLPGASDYYVHDEDGRPVFRIDTPSHDSLCQWLMPIATRLREGLGAEECILLVFDRAGAFPTEMATLRDAGVEFVTYERRPYPDLAESVFDRTVVVRGEKYGVHESRLKNLRDGRGRVRRISLRTSGGKQINLLAVSTAPLEQLVGFLMGEPAADAPSGRWQQENAFKHGAERWGINQLDGRKVKAYPPGTIIPNPARRRNERALKIARADEGRARCALAKPDLTEERRARIGIDLAEAIQRRVALELARPMIAKHAPIEQTELAGKLVYHPAQLKAVVDTMRVVCANIEAELADIIAPALTRPREAKKVVANVFAAPGRVDVTMSEIRVRLSPAANRSEHAAIQLLLANINARNLTLPGDARRRPLHFGLHIL